MLHFFKPKQFQLRIDNPCSENWEQMAPDEKGKFCQSCSKTVIDFTNLSDKRIIDIISKSSGGLCGRLTRNQLNTTISFKKEFVYPNVFSKIAASFLLISLSQSITAHTSQNVLTRTTESPVKNKKRRIDQQTITGDSIITIRGTVLDAKTKETLPGATVRIKNTNQVTATDIEGRFQFDVSSQLLTIDVEISSLAYLKQEVHLTISKSIKTEILLEPYVTLTGDVVITYKGKLKKNEDKPSTDKIKEQVQAKQKWWLFWKKNKTDI